jgi:hypothetical protein
VLQAVTPSAVIAALRSGARSKPLARPRNAPAAAKVEPASPKPIRATSHGIAPMLTLRGGAPIE